jgi:transcriptional regulator with XRE-family HTH domain
MKNLNERLKEVRTEKNISQSRLAKDTGLSQSAISFWESGDRLPSIQAVIILAKYYNVSADYLLGLTD